jgi:hypothetical protein
MKTAAGVIFVAQGGGVLAADEDADDKPAAKNDRSIFAYSRRRPTRPSGSRSSTRNASRAGCSCPKMPCRRKASTRRTAISASSLDRWKRSTVATPSSGIPAFLTSLIDPAILRIRQANNIELYQAALAAIF